jgi:hypothetical protein
LIACNLLRNYCMHYVSSAHVLVLAATATV